MKEGNEDGIITLEHLSAEYKLFNNFLKFVIVSIVYVQKYLEYIIDMKNCFDN